MQMTASKGYPLSMQQARLWALRGESQTYSVQCSVQLKGTLDMTALLDAFQHLVKRHDILRTGFSHLPGMEIPVQAVASYVKVHYPVIDLENLSASDQTALLDEYFTALKHKDVELEAHSPLFIELVRLSSKMHLLFLHLPALCADGETLTQMVAELGQTYTSLLRGTQQDDEPLQYADVAAWQQELVVSEE